MQDARACNSDSLHSLKGGMQLPQRAQRGAVCCQAAAHGGAHHSLRHAGDARPQTSNAVAGCWAPVRTAAAVSTRWPQLPKAAEPKPEHSLQRQQFCGRHSPAAAP